MNPNRHTKALPYQRRISFRSAFGQPTYILDDQYIHLRFLAGKGKYSFIQLTGTQELVGQMGSTTYAPLLLCN